MSDYRTGFTFGNGIFSGYTPTSSLRFRTKETSGPYAEVPALLLRTVDSPGGHVSVCRLIDSFRYV